LTTPFRRLLPMVVPSNFRRLPPTVNPLPHGQGRNHRHEE